MKTKLVNKTVKSYVSELAAKQPTPGGGSAAALCGCLGVSLITMAAEYTKSAKDINDYKKRASIVIKKSKNINFNLLKLVDKDADVYENLSNILKKFNVNSKLTQSALKRAVDVPMKICEYAHSSALLALDMVFAVRRCLISDVEASIYIIDAAFDSAGTNIDVNLKMIKDTAYVKAVRSCYNKYHLSLKKIKAEILAKVNERTRS